MTRKGDREENLEGGGKGLGNVKALVSELEGDLLTFRGHIGHCHLEITVYRMLLHPTIIKKFVVQNSNLPSSSIEKHLTELEVSKTTKRTVTQTKKKKKNCDQSP